MTPRRRVNAPWMAAAIACAALFAHGCHQPSEDSLLDRIAAAQIEWESYQEDLKAQIGPRETAEWEGNPVRVWRDDSVLYVYFDVRGPWRTRSAAIPILLRDPALTVYAHDRVSVDADHVVYEFDLTDAGAAMLPWVEVRYPHHTRRLSLSEPPPA